MDSSRELEDAAAEIDRLVARNTLLEQELDATGAQLHDARAHARSQDSARVCDRARVCLCLGLFLRLTLAESGSPRHSHTATTQQQHAGTTQSARHGLECAGEGGC